MLIERVRAHPELVSDRGVWPWTVPAIGQLLDNGLKFTSDIVILVGGNGAGKSTLLEAIAEQYGIDVRGGHGGRDYPINQELSPLGKAITLDRTLSGRFMTKSNATGFFLRAETAHEMLERMTGYGVQGYGNASWQVSHGESYLQAIAGQFSGPGLYLLDEAEGPLSFESTLQLLYRIQDLVTEHRAQVIYATHSPLVASIPGAQLIELTDEGIGEREWEDLASVNLWRRFLRTPGSFYEG